MTATLRRCTLGIYHSSTLPRCILCYRWGFHSLQLLSSLQTLPEKKHIHHWGICDCTNGIGKQIKWILKFYIPRTHITNTEQNPPIMPYGTRQAYMLCHTMSDIQVFWLPKCTKLQLLNTEILQKQSNKWLSLSQRSHTWSRGYSVLHLYTSILYDTERKQKRSATGSVLTPAILFNWLTLMFLHFFESETLGYHFGKPVPPSCL